MPLRILQPIVVGPGRPIAPSEPVGVDDRFDGGSPSVSLRRKKQFCLLEPKTKTRLEVGLNMKGVEPTGKLEGCPLGGMCSHKIRVEKAEDIDAEVFDWIRKAYGMNG